MHWDENQRGRKRWRATCCRKKVGRFGDEQAASKAHDEALRTAKPEGYVHEINFPTMAEQAVAEQATQDGVALRKSRAAVGRKSKLCGVTWRRGQ